jgi:hypothetical protein
MLLHAGASMSGDGSLTAGESGLRDLPTGLRQLLAAATAAAVLVQQCCLTAEGCKRAVYLYTLFCRARWACNTRGNNCASGFLLLAGTAVVAAGMLRLCFVVSLFCSDHERRGDHANGATSLPRQDIMITRDHET